MADSGGYEVYQAGMDIAAPHILVQSPVGKPAQLHGELCGLLDVFVKRLQGLGPALDVERTHFQKSGVQALCALQLAIAKARSLLNYCADSSKLYLAIKGETMLSQFHEVKKGLEASLRWISVLVSQDLGAQISEIQVELSQTHFQLDPIEKQIGADIISLLLQKQKGAQYENPQAEQETFSQVAIQLGLVTADAILVEKHALKRLLDKARYEEDSRKEAVSLHILQLMKKYNNVLRMENALQVAGESTRWPVSDQGWGSSSKLWVGEGIDGQASPSFQSYLHCTESHGSELGCTTPSMDNHSEQDCSSAPQTPRTTPLPPEELRCPISLQLMSDPVIVASGQTYERVCIEKWFQEGHVTCPKTRQRLSHLNLTPNYCVKGLIASWCEAHDIGVPEPPSPPPSPVTSWRWELLSTSELVKAGSEEQLEARAVMEDQFPSVDTENESSGKESANVLEVSGQELDCRVGSGCIRNSRDVCDIGIAHACVLAEGGAEVKELSDKQWLNRFDVLVADLTAGSLHLSCQAAEEIRVLAKSNAKARAQIGDRGAIPALVAFLQTSISVDDHRAQEVGALALLNVAINNDRNKAAVVAAGGVPLFVELLKAEASQASKEAVVAALLTLSCLNENKACVGSSGAIPLLVQLLTSGSNQARKDALITLYNLTIFLGNRPRVVRAGAIPILVHLLSLRKVDLLEKCVALLYNLSSIEEGRSTIAKTEGGVAVLAEILETGSIKEKEHAAATLLLLCTNSSQHSQLVLREGVIPALVSLSVSGNPRGQEKAQKLLQHFREQRQKETMLSQSAPLSTCSGQSLVTDETMKNGRKEEKKDESRRIRKSRSGSIGFIWKSKVSLPLYPC
ncbi:unnamed protein product [Sphagnum tenellum]